MKLPRSRRITRRADFQRVRTEGESVRGRFLVLGFLRDPNLTEPFKLGLITTRRIGGAVARNRVRRRLRAIVHRTGERISPGHWLVVIARHQAADATSEQLEREWKWLLHRAFLVRQEDNSVPR
ncbi:MAG: ribonuclease P protein component [Verrucomicrobiales bacterium]